MACKRDTLVTAGSIQVAEKLSGGHDGDGFIAFRKMASIAGDKIRGFRDPRTEWGRRTGRASTSEFCAMTASDTSSEKKHFDYR